MIQSPPDWLEILNSGKITIPEILGSVQLSQLINKANNSYLHWDKFRYQPMPDGTDSKLAWTAVKISRVSNREALPIATTEGPFLSVFLNKAHLKELSYIDSYCSGVIATGDGLPSGTQKDKMVINGLIEEAISSSQIEGANTTRKVAKAMIELNRSPKNKDERMILNNYLAMRQLEDWKDRPLDDSFLLELHKVLTSGTMDDPNDENRFRTDADEVVVSDKVTGEVVYIPPRIEIARTQLKQLYAFANADDEDDYIHPFVKASVLHFALAYIHPFVDGNGRSARALFYWYLLKRNYWVFKFLPISLQIKKKDWRPGYDRAFQYVETDEGDVTYFLSYKLKLVRNAIDDFIKYLQKKQKEANQLRDKLVNMDEVSQRQLDVIDFFQRNPSAEIDLQSYKESNKVAYQTARTDLLPLVSRGILRQNKAGKKFVFTRGEKFPTNKN